MTYPNNTADSVAADQLRSFVERIERMHEEKKAIANDIADIYREAKGYGFDTKVLRKIVQDRAKDQNDLAEFEAVYELYMAALGTGREIRPYVYALLAIAAVLAIINLGVAMGWV